MSFKKITVSCAFACIGFLTSVHAASLYNGYVGQYISGGLGMAYAEKLFVNGQTNKNVVGGAGQLFLGDMINRYFGPELGLQYDDLPQMGSLLLFNLNMRLMQPIGDRISLFEKIGVGLGELRTCYQGCYKSDDALPTAGLGVGYGLTSQWMTSLEFNGTYLPTSLKNGKGIAGAVTFNATRFF